MVSKIFGKSAKIRRAYTPTHTSTPMAVSTLNPPSSSTLNSTTAAITSTSPPANEHYDIDNDFDSPSKNRKLSNISASSIIIYQDENHIKSNHARKSSNIPYLLPNHYRQIFLLLWLKQGKGQLQLKATHLRVVPYLMIKRIKLLSVC